MTTEAPVERFVRALQEHGCEPRRSGPGWQARCPGHDDRRASLSVGEGDDGRALLHCHAGCSTVKVLMLLGLKDRDLFADAGARRDGDGRGAQRASPRVAKTYDYQDPSGRLLYQAVKMEPKDFRFRRPDGDGAWAWNLDGVTHVLYRLPQLLAAAPAEEVYVTEGEKDADRLAGAGLVATTNPAGALKWRSAYNKALRGRRVVILADNDPVGRKHAEQVAASLRGVAASVRILELSGLPEHGDVSDWLDSGHTVEELRELAEQAPEWEPRATREDGDGATASTGSARAATREEMRGRLRLAVEPFGRWLHMPDLGAVYAALGTVAANRMSGDPVWLLLVAPSSYGKTEIISALSKLPDTHTAATLTEASLLSGTPAKEKGKEATGGLLRAIGEFGILLLKDFGSILNQNRDSQAQTLAALREVYDCSWTRHVGTDGGLKLHWSGKVGLIGGCTPTIDRRHAVMNTMGERFVFYRLSVDDDAALARAALDHIGKESLMRAELSRAVSQLFEGVDLTREPRGLSEKERERVVALSSFVVRCRSAVERDSHDREIDLIPDPEAPGRLAIVLARLLAGLDVIGLDRAAAWRLVHRVGLDSMPALKRRVIDILAASEGPLETTKVAVAAQYPTTTARRQLEELAAHRVCSRKSMGHGKADEWALTDWARAKLASLTVPETQEGDEREEGNEGGEPSLYTPPRMGGGKTGRVQEPPEEPSGPGSRSPVWERGSEPPPQSSAAQPAQRTRPDGDPTGRDAFLADSRAKGWGRGADPG